MGPRRSSRPRQVVLGGLDVHVLQTEAGQIEFGHHWGSPKRQVVTVTNVDRCAAEFFAGSGASNSGSSLDQQRAHAGLGEVGSGHQSVVACTDHNRIPVGTIW